MKSGPTLKGCTRRPRSFRAARSASVTVVLPTPLCVPAMTSRGKFIVIIVEPLLLETFKTITHAKVYCELRCRRFVSNASTRNNAVAGVRRIEQVIPLQKDAEFPTGDNAIV